MDTIIQTADTLALSAQPAAGGIDVWMIVAIVELLFIIILLLTRVKHDSAKTEAKKRVLNEGDIDLQNIVTSAFNAEPVYKELILMCHPDRFAPDEAKMAIADDLSKRITKSKHDLKTLAALRQEAVEKLNI